MRSIRFAGILALVAIAAFAQSQLGTGAISGVVRDPSGGAVPGAKVTVTNTETGLARQIESNDAGQFMAPVLPPGRYKLLVGKEGFAQLETSDIDVSVGGTATMSLTLKLGSVGESVTVTAETGAIDVRQTDI